MAPAKKRPSGSGDREPLSAYNAKRNFATTPEPAGQLPAQDSGGRRFVVQRHRATRLHYDFRLELDGVLLSWAVPKGPTLDPSVRRLAVHVEDHPTDYIDFEGVIPQGEYGGGDVIVWDRGTWAAVDDDPAAAVESGTLHFDLHGERLAGRFVLTRTGRSGDDKQWLLLHKHDEFAVDGWDAAQFPTSVTSGLTNDEVAAQPTDRATGSPTASDGPGPRWDGPSTDELAALESLGNEGDWHLDGEDLRLTNLDKVLFPPDLTKRDLIRHYARISPFMLRYLHDRPVNLNRFPNGVEQKGFWQKEVSKNAPDFLARWHNSEAESDKTQFYAVVDRPASLVWLANMGTVELHPWTSPETDVHTPSWAYIDIDPGPVNTFDDVIVLARLYRTALEHLGLRGAPKVTGQRGIQIWVPVAPRYTFDQTRDWVEAISRAVGSMVPELVSWSWRKSDRNGRARLDFTQNALNKTLVAPWSVRPAERGPVSVPIRWDELDDADLAPDRWTILDAIDRAELVGDPLANLIGVEQDLPKL